jgi:phosphate transport system protein
VKVIQRTILEAPAHPETIATYLDLLSVGKNLERVADHATNIAEDVIYMSTGKIVRHQRGKTPDLKG